MIGPRTLLRSDLPRSSFSVDEIAHRAKLDQNESPFELPAAVKDEIVAALADERWHRYPQPARYAEIKARFAAAIGLAPERVVLTAGCDQMILCAFWVAGGAGRRARYFEPTYPMYGHYAAITQTIADRVVLDARFDVDPTAGAPVDLLLLVSPNNPTGNAIPRERVVAALSQPQLVFVDEAYGDYAGSSLVPLTDAHDNLLVGRSLSKALLAGVRLGYGVGHPDVVAACERLLFAPYHLSAWQLLVAERFDRIEPHLAGRVQTVVDERERVAAALGALGIEVHPSAGNFLLLSVDDAAATYRQLLDRGVRLRDVSGMPGLGEHLRVTIGTHEENEIFLAAMAGGAA